jgi:hypothetical protein
VSGNMRLALLRSVHVAVALGLVTFIVIGAVTTAAAEDPGQSTSPTPTPSVTPTPSPPSTEIPLPSVTPTVITSPTLDGTFTPSPMPATTAPENSRGTDAPVVVDAGGGPGTPGGRPGWLWAFPAAFLVFAAYAWSRAFSVGRPER